MKKVTKNILKVLIVIITVVAVYFLDVMYSNKVEGIEEKIIYVICAIIGAAGTFLSGWILIEGFAFLIDCIFSMIKKLFSRYKKKVEPLKEFDESDLSEFERSILEKIRSGEIKSDKLEEYLLHNSMNKVREIVRNKKISKKLLLIIFLSLFFYLIAFLSVAIFDVSYVKLETIKAIYYYFYYYGILLFRNYIFDIFYSFIV